MSAVAWRLMVFNAPASAGGLLARHGFKQTKKNPAHWWRLFDPALAGERELAEQIRGDLLAAGLNGKWSLVDIKPAPGQPHPHETFRKHAAPPSKDGFGGTLNARPISGAYRMRRKRP